MRDHRQELILGPARLFRLAPCLLGAGERLALGQPRSRALSDVPSDLGRAHDPSERITDGRYRQRDLDPVPVLPNANRLVVVDPLTPFDLPENLLLLLDVFGRDEDRHGLANRLGGGVAKDPLGACIPGPNDALEALADDRIVRGIDDCGQMAGDESSVVPVARVRSRST